MLAIAWRCLYAEIIGARLDNRPLRLEHALKRNEQLTYLLHARVTAVRGEMAQVVQISKQLHPTYKNKIEGLHYSAAYDLCLMTMCDYHIMANSSFGLWGVELSNTNKVVYPKYWMQGSHVDSESIDDQIIMDLVMKYRLFMAYL